MRSDILTWRMESPIPYLLAHHFMACDHCEPDDYPGEQFRGVFSAAVDDMIETIITAASSSNEKYKQQFSIDKIKSDLRYAFAQDDDFWWLMVDECPTDHDEFFLFSYHISAITVWVERYLPEHLFPLLEHTPDEYHPEMLKLLIKKYIWQPLFPNEPAPYQEPASGLLPSLQQLLPTDGRALALNDCHGWIQRLAP